MWWWIRLSLSPILVLHAGVRPESPLPHALLVQGIALMAREVDPKGQRTIGVITKPDNIPEGDHDKWRMLASNADPKQKLAHGACMRCDACALFACARTGHA